MFVRFMRERQKADRDKHETGGEEERYGGGGERESTRKQDMRRNPERQVKQSYEVKHLVPL